MDKMKKWYATVTREDGTQFEIGGWSKEEIQKDLRDIHRTGFADLDKASVEVYSISLF